jgi:hypothetical protein
MLKVIAPNCNTTDNDKTSVRNNVDDDVSVPPTTTSVGRVSAESCIPSLSSNLSSVLRFLEAKKRFPSSCGDTPVGSIFKSFYGRNL